MATNWFRHIAASFVINGSAIVAARSALGSFTKCSLGIGVPESYVGLPLWGALIASGGESPERVGLHQAELIELVVSGYLWMSDVEKGLAEVVRTQLLFTKNFTWNRKGKQPKANTLELTEIVGS
ncbi:uncharacterized protein LOC116800390 [Drosophila sechellia]|uniref:uncharacterized protein LOC116800390 n=1 Tax=Drosophila sechellia TaxID=7238 RepID=UPI0013DDC552|nr:uncharacterized protein LOC116800390 [Drosophila sechellia]